MREISGPVAVPRLANKVQLASWFEVSLPTVEAWVRKGMPVSQRGSRGVAWQFDLLEVARWKFGQPVESAPGLNGEQVDPATLPPSERKAWYESEIKRRELQVKDRELIPADEVERVTATGYAMIAQTLRSIPDLLERRLALAPEVLGEIESIQDEALNALADALSTVAPAGVGEEDLVDG